MSTWTNQGKLSGQTAGTYDAIANDGTLTYDSATDSYDGITPTQWTNQIKN